MGVSSESIRFLHCDVLSLKKEALPMDFQNVDVCVSNPPFGTRTKYLDFCFVKKGLEFSDVMYSIHKSLSHEFLVKKAREMDANADFLLEDINFPLPQTYSFHKSLEQFITVDVVKFARKRK